MEYSKPNKTWKVNHHLSNAGHLLTKDLTGKAVRLHYKSGHVLEQHGLTGHCILWKGISGELDGHSQTEEYNAVKYLFD